MGCRRPSWRRPPASAPTVRTAPSPPRAGAGRSRRGQPAGRAGAQHQRGGARRVRRDAVRRRHGRRPPGRLDRPAGRGSSRWCTVSPPSAPPHPAPLCRGRRGEAAAVEDDQLRGGLAGALRDGDLPRRGPGSPACPDGDVAAEAHHAIRARRTGDARTTPPGPRRTPCRRRRGRGRRLPAPHGALGVDAHLLPAWRATRVSTPAAPRDGRGSGRRGVAPGVAQLGVVPVVPELLQRAAHRGVDQAVGLRARRRSRRRAPRRAAG